MSETSYITKCFINVAAMQVAAGSLVRREDAEIAFNGLADWVKVFHLRDGLDVYSVP